MNTVATNKAQTYRTNFSLAKRHFGDSYFSARRMGRNAAITFGTGLFFSAVLGPQPVIGIPVLLEWINVARTRDREQATKLLDDLVQSSLEIGSPAIAEDLLSYNRVGQKKMAAEFLQKLKEADKTKFEHVLTILENSNEKKAKRILKEFDKIYGIPLAYRSSLEKAKLYFSSAYLSATSIATKSILALLLIDYTPFEPEAFSNFFGWGAATVGLYTGFFMLVDLIRTRVAERKQDPNSLLEDLIQASLNASSSTIAKDLFPCWGRGAKIMARKFLLKLREADGTKFYQILAILRESRRGRNLAASFMTV